MRALRLVAPTALLLASCTSTPSATAPGPDLPAPRVISEPIRSQNGCQGPTPPFHPGGPSLAADPADARLLVASWQQLGSPIGSGNVVAVTHDGGRRWARSILPGLSACAGGSYASATHPRVSIGPDHNVYVSSLMTRPAHAGVVVHDVVVSVSHDSGITWQQPAVVESQPAPHTTLDKETVLADPRRPGVAYLVWAENAMATTGDSSVAQVFFSRTVDGSTTWSAPAPIYSGGEEAQENHLLMTADGTLNDVFVEKASLPGGPHRPAHPLAIRVIRSKDRGQTWSAPIDAARFSYTNIVDPGTGSQLRFFGQDIAAAAAGNAIYVSWFVNRPASDSSIWVARSEDSGLHWSEADPAVREKPEAFLPTIAVAGDATLGMLWFDFRKFARGSPTLDTDAWFSRSKDRGSHWTTRHVSGPFDLRSAAGARYGPFIGDHMGLVGLKDGFATVFVQARPLAQNGPTDVFFEKIPD